MIQYEVIRQNGDKEIVELDSCPSACGCCKAIAMGVARVGACYMREIDGVFEVRQAVAIMGGHEDSPTDDPWCEPDGLDTFDPRRHFIGNYARGRGSTKALALRSMFKWMTDTSDSLFG